MLYAAEAIGHELPTMDDLKGHLAAKLWTAVTEQVPLQLHASGVRSARHVTPRPLECTAPLCCRFECAVCTAALFAPLCRPH